MKRLIRRSRRSIEKASNIFSSLLTRTREKQGYKPFSSNSLSLEPLESRVLLTTLVLPKGEQGEFIYQFADPEHGENGYNELRIGTLSGMGPEKDVIIEILGVDTDLNPVPVRGDYIATDGTTGEYDGGLNDGEIIDPIAASGLDFHATATDSVGNTFGITTSGLLYRIDTTGEFSTTFIGQVQDTNNPFASTITFSGFESADFAWANIDVDTDDDGFFDDGSVFKEAIYAVVQATLIDDQGIISGEGSVLITIDPLTGEAEPVAQVDGTSSYTDSAIPVYDFDDETNLPISPNITSIVFSEEVHNDSDNTTEPVFIAYDSSSYRFLTLSVEESQFTGDRALDPELMTLYDDNRDNEVWNTGLAYCDYDNDGDTELFATQYTVGDDGGRGDGKLVIVDFGDFNTPGVLTGFTYIEVTEMGVHDEIPDDPPDRWLDSLTYDPVVQAAYSTETFGGLNTYEIILDGLIQTDQGFEAFSGDIFQMYIKQSTADVYITLTRYIITPDGIVYTPQEGTQSFLYVDEDDNDIVTPDSAGGAAIGCTPTYHEDDIWFDGISFVADPSITATAPDDDYPGVWQNGEFRPGIIVEEGNDVGMISIGGPIFGDVIVRDGSIGTFYAGFLGTNEFIVNGDLQNLVVGTQSGGINESDETWMPALNSIYYDYGQGAILETTTTILDVMGQMGSFYSNEDWGLPIRVWGKDDVASFPGIYEFYYSDDTADENPDVQYYNAYREIERKSGQNNNDNVDFYSGSLDYIVNNDTPESAQFLGTTSDGIINVVGSCESWNYDPLDYYGFGALAGEEIEIKLFDTSDSTFVDLNYITGIPYDPGTNTLQYLYEYNNVIVYDPNGNIIAEGGETDPVTGAILPIRFTTEIAGAYTVLVSEPRLPYLDMLFYRLEISGVSGYALGGGTVMQDFRATGYGSSLGGVIDVRPSVQVEDGNLGVINVVGHIHLGQFKTNNGGDIMAVRTLATEEFQEGLAGFVYEIADNGAPYTFEEAYVDASGTIGEVRAAGNSVVNIISHEDIQSIHFDESYGGGVTAYGNIGSFYVGGDFANSVTTLAPSWYGYIEWLIANADGEGAPGVIDSIVVNGSFQGYVSTGRNVDPHSPEVISGSGNVRYVYIGGGGTASWQYEPGETVRLYDDSGSEVILRPGYEGEDIEVTETVTIDGEEVDVTTIVNDGGVISVELLPVYAILPGELVELPFNQWPGSGNVIVSAFSTNGLRVSTKGSDPVEIGLVRVTGTQDNSVAISGSAPVSIFRLEAEAPIVPEENDETVADGVDYNGITSITNSSGWWLNQDGVPYDKKLRHGDKKTTWVGGDILSIVVADVFNEDDGVFLVPEITTAEIYEQNGIEYGSELNADELAALDTVTYDLATVKLKGHLGYTESTTGQKIVAPLVYAADPDAVDPQVVTPGGSMYNGMYSTTAIENISIAGRVDGNVYVGASVVNITLNSDNSDFENQFDGVSAAIIIRGNLNRIDVGDGLEDPGTGEWAQAGIFVSNDINYVQAKGYDHDIAGAIIAAGDINRVAVLDGADLEGYNYKGTSGWDCPSIATQSSFREFGLTNDVFTYLALSYDNGYSFNELLIKGEDSEMVGAYIKMPNINKITVTGNADGIDSSYIFANVYGHNMAGTINSISVCGYGIRNSIIDAGYSVNKIDVKRNSDPEKGNIVNTAIYSDLLIGTITADIIEYTTIHGAGESNINQVKKVTARDSIYNLVLTAGSLDSITAKNNITGSSLWVEGDLDLIKTGGDLISNIVVSGDYSTLKKVIVGGDMGTLGGGYITVEGEIGMIKVKGDFEANLNLNQSHQFYADADYVGYELNRLDVGGIIDLSGDIYGDVASIKSGGDFGKTGDELNIYGNLKSLQIGKGRNQSELLTDLYVEGDLGSIKTTGDIEGDISVVGDVKSISVNRSSKLDEGENENTAAEHGLNGDLTIGGDLKSVMVKNGDYNGAFNVAGTVTSKKTSGCDDNGFSVIDGLDDKLEITGSITSYFVSTNDVKEIYLLGGENEEGSLADTGVILIDGDLDKLVVDDSIQGVIYVTGNIGSISAKSISGASIVVGGNIGKIDVESDIANSIIVAGYDPGAGGTIDVADFAKIDGEGTDDFWNLEDFQGQSWAADKEADWIAADYTSDDIQKEICEAYRAYLLTKFTIEGDVTDTREVATSGNIKSVDVEVLRNSSIVAGVSPGRDGVFGDLNGTDKAGNGISSIGNITIGSVVGVQDNGAYLPFGIFADGEIGKLKVGKTVYNIPLQPLGNSGFRAWEIIDLDEFDLTAKPGTQLLSFESGDNLIYPIGSGSVSFTLRGEGRGAVQIDTATGEILAIQLKGTTSKSSVYVQTKKMDQELLVGRIFTDDDASINNLIVDGTLVYSADGQSLNIGGNVKKLALNGIDSTQDGIDAAMSLSVDGSIGNLMIGGQITADADNEISFAIQGDVSRAKIDSVTTYATIEVGYAKSIQVAGEFFEGTLVSEGDLDNIQIKGSYDGLIFAGNDINRVTISGAMGALRTNNRPEATVSAEGVIKSFSAGSMENASVVAGEDFYNVKIAGDVTRSDIVAGVILKDVSDLRGSSVEVYEGDIKKVYIGGNFVESNIAAGVAPGEDGLFSTGDDLLRTKIIEKADAPKVESVDIQTSGSGTGFNTIVVKLVDTPQDNSSNIDNIKIKGVIEQGQWSTYEYAITAAGNIDKVVVHGRRFSGNEDINLHEVSGKQLNTSLINKDVLTLNDVASSAMWVQVDGLDQRFAPTEQVFQEGVTDDTFVYGSGVSIRFDEATNSILFVDNSGLLENLEGANYYKVILNSDVIVNMMGIALDGEFTGEMPSGDSQPGGDFIYTFAVGDVGDLATTAFAPFDENNGFPQNYYWEYSSMLGDSREYTGGVSMLDNDYYTLNGLEKGQILSVRLTDLSMYEGAWNYFADWYDNVFIELQKIEEHADYNDLGGFSTIAYNEYFDGLSPAPTVASELSEIFYSGSDFYGYDDEGGNFFKIYVESPDGIDGQSITTFDVMANDLIDVNSTIRDRGIINSLYAFSGHTGDTFWAMAEYVSAGGVTEDILVQIQNIERDVEVDQDENLGVFINQTTTDLSSYGIVGLVEDKDYSGGQIRDILYGVTADGTLYELNSDINDNDFGKVSNSFGQMVDTDGVVIDDLNVTGISLSREGDGLLILHDLQRGDYSSTRTDAIYKVTFNDSNQPQAEYWLNPDPAEYGQYNFAGLASSPDGYTLVGMPNYGSPKGDTFTVTYANETQEHVFGSDDVASLQAGLLNLYSDLDNHPENKETFSFVQNDLYYGFTIEYNSALTGQLQVEIDDIDFWETVTIDGEEQTMLAGSVVDWAYSDNPFVDVTVLDTPDVFGNVSSSLIIDIDASFAEGKADIYFSADSGVVWTMGQFSMDKIDELQGKDTRKAYTNGTVDMPQHDMIMPDITDLTISPVVLEVSTRLDATDVLDFNLRKYLDNYLYGQLEGELDTDLLFEIQEDLIDKGQVELLAEFNASLVSTYYNALAYDPVQEVFALVSTYTYDAKPIMVEDPIAPEKGDVELTIDVLGQIYNIVNPSSDGQIELTITDIKGIEFGEVKLINAPDGSAIPVERPELWAIVEVTSTNDDESVSSDHLIKFEDILYPGENMVTSDWTMGGFDLENVSELAFGSFPESSIFGDQPVLSEDKNELFGFDTDTNTLIRFDTREVKIDTDSDEQEVIVNVDFGRPEIIGTIDSAYDITAMDFDSKTRLLAVENNGNSIIQIDTALNAGEDRTKTIELLEEGNYQVLTFDSTLDDSEPILIRQVEGTVEVRTDGADGMHIRVDDSAWTEYYLGETTLAPIGDANVTVTSDTTMEHGYYNLNITYDNTGDIILLTIDDIDWSVLGDVDSVKIDDTSNAAIIDYDDNTIVISIDTATGPGVLDLYFGATVDILRPGLGFTTTTPVTTSLTVDPYTGTMELVADIEEDGDYVLRVGPTFNLSSVFYSFFGFSMVANENIEYGLTIHAFNDGDSDFGISVTDSGLTYESSAPNDSAVDLSASSLGTEWIADERRYNEDSDATDDILEDNLYLFNRDEIAGSTDWSMRAEGELLTADVPGHIEITSELAMLQDVDVYKVELSEGQKMIVDVDGLKLTGGLDVEFIVGVYNGNLESVATVYTDTTDTVTPEELIDPHYIIQAINKLPDGGYTGEDGIFDPMVLKDADGDQDLEMVGTYYIVVSMMVGAGSDGFTDSNTFGSVNPYVLSITTTEGGADKIEANDDPQLVYLSFGNRDTGENINADYLLEGLAGLPMYDDVVERPAFSLDDFEDLPEYFYDDVDGDGLADDRVDVTWDYMVARMAVQIENAYRDALDDPSTPDVREDLNLIQFVTDIDIHVDRDGDGEPDYPDSEILSVDEFNISRMEHSSVVIGGTYPLFGLAGIAETVDRHNENRSDMCTVGSASIGDFYNLFLDGTDKENVDMAVTTIAGTAIHELGHILGLEHSTEVDPDLTTPVGSAAVYEPDNVMNYNLAAVELSGAKFEERNKMADSDYFGYIITQPGFQNEIDSLLRNLGTNAPVIYPGELN